MQHRANEFGLIREKPLQFLNAGPQCQLPRHQSPRQHRWGRQLGGDCAARLQLLREGWQGRLWAGPSHGESELLKWETGHSARREHGGTSAGDCSGELLTAKKLRVRHRVAIERLRHDAK